MIQVQDINYSHIDISLCLRSLQNMMNIRYAIHLIVPASTCMDLYGSDTFFHHLNDEF